MFLHHFVTCALIYFSYICNFGAVGLLIVYLHYIADIFVAGAKCFNELKGVTLAASFLTLMMLSWAWT